MVGVTKVDKLTKTNKTLSELYENSMTVIESRNKRIAELEKAVKEERDRYIEKYNQVAEYVKSTSELKKTIENLEMLAQQNAHDIKFLNNRLSRANGYIDRIREVEGTRTKEYGAPSVMMGIHGRQETEGCSENKSKTYSDY